MTTTPTWATEIRDWITWLTAAGQSSETLRLRRHQMNRCAAAFPTLHPYELTTVHLSRWLASHGWSTETIRSHRAALTSFYRWAVRIGHTDRDPAAALPPIRPPEHYARPAPDLVFKQAVIGAEPRVQTMIMLAGLAGLRRGEISRIHTRDLRVDREGWTLIVHGKGARVRQVPLLPEVARRLISADPGWLFPGQVQGHLSPARVGELVSGSLGEGWTCHTLRHRFATATYAGCRDILVVQALLGHSKVETTQTYVRMPDDAMRAAVRLAAVA